MLTETVYLDHSATTPVDDRVFAVMEPYFSEFFGNPSSLHRQGQRAEAAVAAARQSVASILGCSAGSIFFTACATESNNLVLHGLAITKRDAGQAYHALTTPIEHPSVIEPLRHIQSHGAGAYSFLPVDRAGKLRAAEYRQLVTDEISLVSIVLGNNEIGTINPISEVGDFLKHKPALLHTDAVQAANFIELDVDKLGVDFLTLSAHKFYGPKGVGILYARDPALITPLMQGGSQESGVRPGTHNVPLIVGAAKALELAQAAHQDESTRLRPLRDRLIHEVLRRIPECELTGDPEDRLPHHASFVFADIDSNELLASLDLHGYACSSGSACKVGNPEPYKLLLALGYSENLASGALRVTLGKSSSAEIIDAFLNTLIDVIGRLRNQEAD